MTRHGAARARRTKRFVPGLFVALALAIAAGAYVAYALARQRFLANKTDELGAIADLKVSEIVTWRAERLADARVTARDPLLVAGVRDWLAAGARPEAGAALQSRLDSLSEEYGYERVSLLDAQGRLRLTAPKAALGRVESDELARQAREATEISFIDLHLPDTGEGIHLELVAPLRLGSDPDARPVAFLELRIDPHRFLYPLIVSWPTPSRSAETLLIRREGDFVVYLNELRHRKATAISLRLPISRSDLPAAQAVQGNEGSVDGRDYRGVRVLAAFRRVPGSPWFIVSKVDHAEVVAPLARDAWLIAMLALALIALAGLVAQRLWQRERDVSDAERRESEARHRALFENSLNGVGLHEVVVDSQGRAVDYVFLEVNPAFEKLTGLKREDVVGRRATEVLPGIEKDPFIEIYGRVVATGEGVRFEQFATPLGRHYDVAAFRVAEGQFAAVFSDVSERKRAEERLRLQGAALEAAANAVMITDREGRIVWVNEAFAGLTGWSLEACRGKTPRILKSGHHDQKFYEDLWRTILGGAVWQQEMVNFRKDREIYIEEQTITPVTDERGEISHFVAIKIDVTDRRKHERALRESEARYRALAETSQDDIFTVDAEGRLLYVNARAAAMFGCEPGELQGRDLDQLFPPDLSAPMKANVQRVASTRQPVYDERELSFPGGSVWLGTWLVPLGEGEEPSGSVMGVARDITQRRRAEAALRESEERHRVLAESASDAIVIIDVVDQKPRVSFVNRAAEQIFGYSQRELLDADLTMLMPEDLRQKHLAGLERYMQTGEKHISWIGFESRALHKSGREVPIEVSYGELRREGQNRSFVGIIRDITERKRLEAQLRQAQKMEAIGQLAAGVAHDFNNLLSVIGGYSELVLGGLPADDPQRKRIEGIRKAGERAADLTRQLLTFGRKHAIAPVVLDLSQVVSGLEGMLRRLIPEHIEIVTRFDSGAAKVRADPGHMEQVILNLAVNARDAMPDGGRLIVETSLAELDEAYCRGHAPARPGRYVMLAVSDNGTGMDAETQARIFEPFFTTKETGKGTGLGLATVYGIVKQHEGYVWVYSELGRGTTFKVYLPRVDEVVEGAEEAPARLEAQTGSETILLVEDDEAVRELNREILEERGYRVVEAWDGAAALEASASYAGPIHLLLTDMVMPGMTGRQLADRLRSSRPGIRVLFVSGYTNDVVVRNGHVDPGIAFLQKPFTPDSLGRKIREVLGASE